jgi:peptidoglycan/LPS O-acetylase OafA/YrhL
MHRESRNQSIQVLRGIAAMMVVVFHCHGQINWGDAFNPFVFAQGAWIGVDIFFAISGYVIGMSAINHSGSTEYNSTYWRARAARILPLYYVTTISYLLLLRPEAVLDKPALHIGTHVLLIHGFFSETMYSINGVTWSLAIELQFYALAYVFTPRLLRMKTSTVMFAFLATVLTAIAYRAVFFQVMTISGASTTAIAHQLSQAPSLMEGFAFGLLLAVLRRNSVALPKFPVSTFLFILITAYLVHHYVFNAVRENYWANPMVAILGDVPRLVEG